MSPERFFADVQYDVVRTQSQFRAFHIADGANRAERASQCGFVDPPLGTPPLGSGLGFGHAFLYGLYAVAAGQRTPRRHPVDSMIALVSTSSGPW